MKVVLTGAEGFLGWHTRCLLHATTDHTVEPVGRDTWSRLPELVADADAVIHIAGINRADESELVDGNVGLARDVVAAVRAAGRPVDVVFANSTQVGNGSPYAAGKAGAADELRALAAECGGRFTDVLLPNLFGEHGRPGYNSFVASFVDAVIRGEEPSIADRPIALLHAQGAARVLVGALDAPAPVIEPQGTETSVLHVWETLRRFHTTYAASGDVPAFADALEVDLFNTYRAALFPAGYPISLTPRSDQRGRLVETVRSHGNGGQTFVSTTVPGVTRGEHYHLTKIERFVVLSGQATISLRKMFTDEVLDFPVTGEEPALIDMPTMWAHNITNTGDTEVTTLFWTDTLFDPANPDTIPEPVVPAHTQEASS
jgi:UDP-2-acetamido-2,6-beta-L-arabino-hexul-4-ose reductase